MKHKKTIIIGVVLTAIVLIVSALVNSTYALFSNDAYGANTNAYTTGMLLIEASSKSENISLDNVLPITDEEGLKTNPYVFTIKNIGNLDYLFDVKLLSTGDSSTSFSPQYIKLQIDDGDVVTLASLTNGEIKSDITLHAGDSIDVSIRVWLSIDTPNSEIGKSFNSKIVTDGQAVYTSSNNELNINAAQYITSLYSGASKTVVTNNGIEYNQAQSVSLMNDRLGGTTSGYDSGNIRYYGANPNNYIYFNCSDYSNQNDETCEKWRIIGVFDGKLKLIRDESIGGYSWDYNSDGTMDNDWSDATLNKLLNETYYNSGITTYYNGSTTGTSVDFSTSGITAATRANELISESTWYINGLTGSDIYSNVSYTGERTGNNLWIGNIGLAYPSDYGYATNINDCQETIGFYDSDENCILKNWLVNVFVEYEFDWFITPVLNEPSFAFIFSDYSTVGKGTVSINNLVVPVLYLTSDVSLNYEGDGSSDNPYQIQIQPKTEDYTPVNDFTYILGSEQSKINKLTSCYYFNDYGEDENGDWYEGLTDYCNEMTKSVASITLSDDEILLVRYKGESSEVSIPGTYFVGGNTYNVVVLSSAYYIDDWGVGLEYITGLFYENDDISSVLFDNSVKFVSSEIWYGENVYIEEGQYWEYNGLYNENKNSMKYLFYGCENLENVPIIPDTVTSMNSTFYGCTSLTGTVRINSGRVTNLNYIFYGTSNPITVEVPVGSTTYTKINSLGTSSKPKNITIETHTPSAVEAQLSDFVYVLGSEQSTVNEVSGINQISYSPDDWPGSEFAYEYGANITIPVAPITLASNEVLLISYIGDDLSVYVPDTYTIDGNVYNVVVLSFAQNWDVDIVGFVKGEIRLFDGNQNSVQYGNNVDILKSEVGCYDGYGTGDAYYYGFPYVEVLYKNNQVIYIDISNYDWVEEY